MRWQPKQYDSFSSERAQPISDLLKEIPHNNFQHIYDLGCGTGAAINPLKERWPDAKIIGVDSDKAMLATAQKNHPDVSFEQGDILSWVEKTKANSDTLATDTLVFSNAALHWLDDHHMLFPKLLKLATNGGCLAVQMPNNWQEPSHVEMLKLAKTEPYTRALQSLIRERPVLNEEEYQTILAPITTQLNIWSTSYNHNLSGEDPVINWLKGSSLKYYLDGLNSDHQTSFLAKLSERLDKAYVPDNDGNTCFKFIRLFVVAQG